MTSLFSKLLSRPSAAKAQAQKGDRPAPRKVDLWFHATKASHLPSFLHLHRRLALERPDITCLLTTDGSLPRPDALETNIHWRVLKPGSTGATDLFWHFAPQLCVWAGGAFAAPLLEADKRGITLILLDAQTDTFQTSLWPGQSLSQRRVLKLFSACFARDDAARNSLIKMGLPAENVFVSGPLQEGLPPPGCNEAALDSLAAAIKSRPTWLAAGTNLAELDILLPAHIKASRSAHRLLLILLPDQERDSDAFQHALEHHQLRYTLWPDLDGLGDESAQVLLAKDPAELGLFLRVAPICFMGCSLVSGCGGHSPYSAANLGSALVYGPNVGKHLESYARFAAAGGAHIVRDTQTLAAAVSQLSAPDRAAKMAMAAWEIATNGAAATDRVTALIHDTLDQLETR